MEITAADVMHGFWIPEFRMKQDAIPGRTTEVRFTPTVAGEYAVVCSELCGSGHGAMAAKVVVESQDDYDKYVQSLIIHPPTKPGSGDHNADWGKYLVVSHTYSCYGCHALADAGINGQTGPAWTNIADIAGNQVPGQDARTRLTHAILYPNEYVVPGYPANVMPQNFGTLMDDVDLNSVVDYLLKQTANPAGATSAQPAATAATP
jgi:mono/diheme cytochrome c family protein